MTFTIEKRPLKTEEYQLLRASTNWPVHTDETVAKALRSDLFSVCVLEKGNPIGIGRIVGDGALYYYIQDVIVLPDYQKRGVGKLVMMEIEKYLNKNCAKNAFIGLMAAKGVEGFYKKFGYVLRSEDAPGMYKIV